MNCIQRYTKTESTSIKSLAFNPHSKVLTVRFRNDHRFLYEYEGVTNDMVTEILEAERHGVELWDVVIGNCNSTRLRIG